MSQYVDKQVQRFIAKLNNLNDPTIITRILNRAGIYVENIAKENLTANGSVQTGDLRRSITHETNGNECEVYTTMKYAPYVEFGTGLFARDGDGRKDVPWHYQDASGEWHSTSGQQPKPFMEPALVEHIPEIEQLIASEYKQEIQKLRNA